MVAAVLAALLEPRPIAALDPQRALSQYMHDRWTDEQGWPGDAVSALAQTPDGYLWIGSTRGLTRFDGESFRLVQPPAAAAMLPITQVVGLHVDGDAALWVRLRGARIVRYHHGVFTEALRGMTVAEVGVTAMAPAREGGLLVAGMMNGLLRLRGQGLETLAAPAALPRSLVISLAETTDGLWMGTRDAGLFRRRAGTGTLTNDLPGQKINCLLPGSGRDLWIGTDSGLYRWTGTTIERARAAAKQILALTRDRDHNLWAGTSTGLVRVDPRGDAAAEAVGRDGSPGAIATIVEDRERNLWTGGVRGLERWRDGPFVSYASPEGLPSDTPGALHPDRQGRLWFAPLRGGLYWLDAGGVGQARDPRLDADVVYSIAGRGADLWAGTQRNGLVRLRPRGGGFDVATFTSVNGLAQNSVYAVHEARDGAVWAGTLSGGVSRLHAGRVTTFTTADGLASNSVAGVLESADGTMWFATPGGLSALSRGGWRTYREADGLPSRDVTSLAEDSGGVLWIGTAAGLAYRTQDRIRVAGGAATRLDRPILGVAVDRRGAIWLTTPESVLRVSPEGLRGAGLRDAGLRDGDVRAFGPDDGLRAAAGVRRHRTVVDDGRGRIWLSLARALSVVDPARATAPAPPALIVVQRLIADGEPIELRPDLRLPAGRQRLTFTYAGLSLSSPDRVRFRYRLDGFDAAWSPPVAAREAVYTNLAHGDYAFRVAASNGDGAWSPIEAVVPFSIEPALWQTWWFRLALGIAALGALVALYRARLRQVSRQLQVRFDERLAERARIAQELHDTLLQGFVSASMQLHVATDRLPEASPAKAPLVRVLDLMGRVIEDGRRAVQGLRASPAADDLEQAFSRVHQELGATRGTACRILVEGQPRAIHPLVRDEAYRIGREALVNAFRHAAATAVETELAYAPSHLRILVRDDGAGIDPTVMRSGREGHWGLTGMRERAEAMGAQLVVRSRAGAGTEVELTIPASVAFENPPGASPLVRAARRVARRLRMPATGAGHER